MTAYTPTEIAVKLSDFAEAASVGLHNPRPGKLPKVPELAASIATNGLRTRIPVWEAEREGKKYMVRLGGERRFAAIGLLIEKGDTIAENGQQRANEFVTGGVPCLLYEAANLLDAKYLALSDNLDREDLSTYAIAAAMGEFRTAGDNQKTIASKLNKSESWVSRKLNAYEKACQALRDAWAKGLADETVEEIAKGDHETQEKALALLKGGAKPTKKKSKSKGARAERLERPSGKVLQAFVVIGESMPKDAPDYCRGVRDAMLIASGMKDPSILDKSWKAMEKQLAADAVEAEKAAKAAEKAAEKAAKAEKAGKKGSKNKNGVSAEA